MRNGDDNISLLHASGGERKTQRVCATIHGNAVGCIREFRELSFKSLHHLAADETGRVQGRPKHGNKLFFQLTVRSYQIKKRNILIAHNYFVTASWTALNTRAGFPATMVLAGTSLVTTLPAPTMAFSPIVTLARMVEPDPMDARRFTSVLSTFQSASVCRPPVSVVARGYMSLMKVT